VPFLARRIWTVAVSRSICCQRMSRSSLTRNAWRRPSGSAADHGLGCGWCWQWSAGCRSRPRSGFPGLKQRQETMSAREILKSAFTLALYINITVTTTTLATQAFCAYFLIFARSKKSSAQEGGTAACPHFNLHVTKTLCRYQTNIPGDPRARIGCFAGE